MLEVNVTELRKHLPQYLKRVGAGETVRITSRGRVIARLLPDRQQADESAERLAALRGSVIVGDVVDAGDEAWSADADHL